MTPPASWIETEDESTEVIVPAAVASNADGSPACQLIHDLMNFLAGMGMLTKSLRHNVAPAPGSPADKQIAMLAECSKHAAEICEHLQSLIRRGDRETDCECPLEIIDLSAAIAAMQGLLEVMLPPTATLHTELADKLPPIAVNRTELQQLVLDLFTNAAEALAPGGCITIRTGIVERLSTPKVGIQRTSAGSSVFLEVVDTGCGMGDETLQHLCEPTFTTKCDGHGLGMASVLRILDSYEGTLMVNSKVDRGTTVRCVIPCHGSGDGVAAASRRAGDTTPGKILANRPMTILLVEDNEAIRMASKIVLETSDRGQFTVIECGTGKDALEVLGGRAREVSVIVLDMNLPDWDGVELFWEFRQRSPVTPIVGISGTSERLLAARIDTRQFDELLAKPFGPEELITSLIRVVGGAPPQEATSSSKVPAKESSNKLTKRAASAPMIARGS